MDSQVSSVTALRGMLAGVFDLAAAPTGEGASVGFSARATNTYVLSRIEAPSIRLLRGADTILMSALDEFALLLVVSGTIQGRIGEGRFEARAGDVIVIDLAQTLDVTLAQGETRAETLVLWLSRGQMLAATPNENLLHGLVLAKSSPAGALVGAGLTLLAQAGQLPPREFDAVADGIVALMAKIIAPVLEQRACSGAQALASFVTIRRYIDKNLNSPTLNAARLANTFGLSRAALYRLFEPVGGVACYIRRARLGRAYQEIVSSEAAGGRIGPIAYGLGFKNLSAFNRLFRESFGVSPSEARRNGISRGEPIAAAERPAPGGDSLCLCLKRLGASGASHPGAAARAPSAAERMDWRPGSE
ncbi:AraC-like DNA-binding protein [Rhodoblastus sphagnicola]|nr:helix-turn-helix domain-containing protein [Rhodoblastus sphagnicola]MBB4196766.1 AraC-like DNA-binding protein [Rhodoblastus sphagnicola]